MDNTGQIEYWNGAAGRKWVQDAERLDAMLRPFADAVMAAAEPKAGERAVDIGCGAGALSLMAAAAGAAVTGVDVSEPLIALAQGRARGAASFTVADASDWQPEAKADLVLSRFGVMFFADPGAAFANIRQGVKAGGRIAFVCWRPLAENDWALIPLAAAMPLLKQPPAPPPPGAPGPFAFGDRHRIVEVLAAGGWTDVRITPWDGQIELPGESVEETAAFMLEIGPLSRTIAEQDIDPRQVKDAIIEKVRTLKAEDGRTRLSAAAWIVEAVA
ncbi:MAG: class I SAM-dependent methyltransferase [Hyphomonas sp.]